MKNPERTGLDEAIARAGDGAFAIGPDGRIVLWNRAAEKMLGYGAREAIGRPCCDLFVGHDDSGNRLCYQGCHVMSLVKMGDSVQSFDMQTRTKAGRPIWVNLSTLTVPAGQPGGPLTVHLFRDVTATKELLGLVRERLTAPAVAEPTRESLTRRELEILRMIATGVSTKAAADTLHVSPATVRNHVQNILGKLGAHSRLEAVAMATRQRLL
ncbi:MAG TPA: LuxR C-terminal-related transcriptional regulator [Methylomirabilota bacterium]|nr:LuxR C-terminal-related transcriptional regulator [Methylomirabilota bacterium]